MNFGAELNICALKAPTSQSPKTLAVIVKNRRIETTIPSHENKNIYSRRFY
jgi:hypothetical protein